MPKERKDGLIQKFGPVLISNIKIAVMTDNQYLPMLYTFCKDSFKKMLYCIHVTITCKTYHVATSSPPLKTYT